MPRMNVAKLVRKEIQRHQAKTAEVKHRQVSLGWGLDTTPYGYNLLEYISQGDGAQNREGNRIHLLSHSIRANFVAEQPYNNIRVMVLETRKPLDYDPVMFRYDGSPCLATPSLGINSAIDYDTVKKVYYDRTIQIAQKVAGVNPVFYLRKYLKFGKTGKKIVYDGNTTGINSGNDRTYLYFLAMSDSSVIPHPNLSSAQNLRFVDN